MDNSIRNRPANVLWTNKHFLFGLLARSASFGNVFIYESSLTKKPLKNKHRIHLFAINNGFSLFCISDDIARGCLDILLFGKLPLNSF
jgi:hypothetical protein